MDEKKMREKGMVECLKEILKFLGTESMIASMSPYVFISNLHTLLIHYCGGNNNLFITPSLLHT